MYRLVQLTYVDPMDHSQRPNGMRAWSRVVGVVRAKNGIYIKSMAKNPLWTSWVYIIYIYYYVYILMFYNLALLNSRKQWFSS